MYFNQVPISLLLIPDEFEYLSPLVNVLISGRDVIPKSSRWAQRVGVYYVTNQTLIQSNN